MTSPHPISVRCPYAFPPEQCGTWLPLSPLNTVLAQCGSGDAIRGLPHARVKPQVPWGCLAPQASLRGPGGNASNQGHLGTIFSAIVPDLTCFS